jgi:hypothetical protein
MEYEIHYSQEQLESAAEFVWNNNPHCSVWPTPCNSVNDVRESILKQIRHQLAENMAGDRSNWVSAVGTGGFYVSFSTDDDSVIDVEIHVDPAVGKRKTAWTTEFVS